MVKNTQTVHQLKKMLLNHTATQTFYQYQKVYVLIFSAECVFE